MPSANSRPASPRSAPPRGQLAELHRGARPHGRRPAPLDAPKAAPELHDDAADAAVADQHVRCRRRAASGADRPLRASRTTTPSSSRRVWPHQHVGRPADANDVCRPAAPPPAPERRTGRAAAGGARRATCLSAAARWVRRCAAEPGTRRRCGEMSPAPRSEHQVARPRRLEERVGQAVAARHEPDVEVAAPLERPTERLARHAVDRTLAGGVDVGEEEHVGVVEGARGSRRRGRACACSDAAGRPRPGGGRSPRARRAAWRGSPRGGGRSRRPR